MTDNRFPVHFLPVGSDRMICGRLASYPLLYATGAPAKALDDIRNRVSERGACRICLRMLKAELRPPRRRRG